MEQSCHDYQGFQVSKLVTDVAFGCSVNSNAVKDVCERGEISCCRCSAGTCACLSHSDSTWAILSGSMDTVYWI